MIERDKSSKAVETLADKWGKAFRNVGDEVSKRESQFNQGLANAREVRDVVLDRFQKDIGRTFDLYDRLARGDLSGVNFDLGEVFGDRTTETDLKNYLSPFTLPDYELVGNQWRPEVDKYSFPPVTIPVTCNIKGEGSVYDNSSLLVQSKLGSGLVSFSPFGKLPLLVDTAGYTLPSGWEDSLTASDIRGEPTIYTFAPKLRGKLLESDGIAADFALQIYRDIARELREKEGAQFASPKIARLLAVVPTPVDGSYVAEFAPEVLWRKEDKNKAYSPYAMVAGARNNCGNYLTDNFYSSRRVVLRTRDGKEALWKIQPLTAITAESVQKELEETTLARSLAEVNHAALILFPYKNIERPERRRKYPSSSYFSADLAESFDVGEAAVTEGTKGWAKAERRDEYFTRFVADRGGQPYIYLIRFLTLTSGR